MDWKNKQFQDLKAKWYKKLKKSGFEDAEQDEERLKSWSLEKNSKSRRPGASDSDVAMLNSSKAEYYRQAGFFLHEYKFESRIDRYIWEKHANGVSHRNIAKILNKLGHEYDRNKVLNIITKLRVIMYKACGILHE